ncbi:MAG TPA: FHA domain-containing protein [Steroidobacteraceae bacterium]|nr:FHA domain-containing protein [Steroidobacteraceae bacterium]
MKPQQTTARPPVDLDATDEFPVLDATAYEAEVLSRETAGPSGNRIAAADADLPAMGSPASDHRGPDAAPPAIEADVMSAVEHWIAQKSEELRAHHEALSVSQRERTAAIARADALSRELAETSAKLEALSGRERALAASLSSEQEAGQRRIAELDAAQREAARLGQELTDTRAAGTQQNAALASSGALLEQRSGELRALQHTHEALIADRQQAARALSELETRLRDSEARERNAQRTLETQNHAHAELTRRVQREASERERLAAELVALQAQLANCVESLHSRESYRAIYESTLQEVDAELAVVMLRASEQEARANQLDAELQSRDRRLQDLTRERDEARQLHDTGITRHAAERGEGERKQSALESRLITLTAEHADAHARLLATEAELTAARQRAEAEGRASAAAAERGLELESALAARQGDLTEARLEIERSRALLADLTAALLKSQTMFSDQGRLLEEREAAASTMAAAHAEQTALITSLRGKIEELSARLATPDVERRTLEERVAGLTREVAESDSRITRLESMNADLRATVGQLDALLAERDAELQRTTQIASINAQALGRVQSSIDELGRTLTASEGASAQAQVSILTRIDNGQNHSVVLRGRTTIGRDRDNDLSLAMRSVSRHHAVMIPAFRTAFIQDLSSTNGVRVNQRRVRCARLEHGDVITVGEAQFRYTVAPAPAGVVSTGSAISSSTRPSLKHAS